MALEIDKQKLLGHLATANWSLIRDPEISGREIWQCNIFGALCTKTGRQQVTLSLPMAQVEKMFNFSEGDFQIVESRIRECGDKPWESWAEKL